MNVRVLSRPFVRARSEARRTSGWGGLLYVLPALALLLVFEVWPVFNLPTRRSNWRAGSG